MQNIPTYIHTHIHTHVQTYTHTTVRVNFEGLIFVVGEAKMTSQIYIFIA